MRHRRLFVVISLCLLAASSVILIQKLNAEETAQKVVAAKTAKGAVNDMQSKVMPKINTPEGGYYAAWPKSKLADDNFFPIGVWMQNPNRAAEYKAIGINFYIGLWNGPTEQQLSVLKQAGMPVICSQNDVGLRHVGDPDILAWMHEDEPDNAQADGKGGWGPPIPPEKIKQIYEDMRAKDASRPVLLNLGQGVAWDRWYGRGVRTNKPEDYPKYSEGADILSFDIYPVVSKDADVKGQLWRVPFGVDRLIQFSGEKKPTWTCIECTRISNPNVIPTPEQVKAEVWMAIIHGSRGIIYFVHQFEGAGRFIEAALLADAQMSKAVGEINREITRLAPVINSPNIGEGAQITSENPAAPVDVAIKKYKSDVYLFAVGMRDQPTKATFYANELKGKKAVEVIGESREIPIAEGRFTDDFAGHAVHLYRAK